MKSLILFMSSTALANECTYLLSNANEFNLIKKYVRHRASINHYYQIEYIRFIESSVSQMTEKQVENAVFFFYGKRFLDSNQFLSKFYKDINEITENDLIKWIENTTNKTTSISTISQFMNNVEEELILRKYLKQKFR